jgi:hypothetical protein
VKSVLLRQASGSILRPHDEDGGEDDNGSGRKIKKFKPVVLIPQGKEVPVTLT